MFHCASHCFESQGPLRGDVEEVVKDGSQFSQAANDSKEVLILKREIKTKHHGHNEERSFNQIFLFKYSVEVGSRPFHEGQSC